MKIGCSPLTSKQTGTVRCPVASTTSHRRSPSWSKFTSVKVRPLHRGNFSLVCSNSTLFVKKSENPFHMNQATVACSPSSAPSIDSPSSVHHSSSSSSSSPKRPSKTRSVSSSSMKISIIADIIVKAAPT